MLANKFAGLSGSLTDQTQARLREESRGMIDYERYLIELALTVL
jgi:hypothetical protein